MLSRRTRRGAGLADYGLVVALIAIIVIGALTALGSSTQGLFTGANSALTGSGSGHGGGPAGEPEPLTFTTSSDPEADAPVAFDGPAGHESYSWDFGDGVGTSSVEDPTYTFVAPGTYSVSLTTDAGTVNFDVEVAAPLGFVLLSENFDADNTPAGWSGLATNFLEAGAARTADNALGLSPEVAVTPGQMLALSVDTKDNSGSATDYIGICFRATSGAAVTVSTDCVRVATATGGYIEQVAGAFVPEGMSFAMVYLSGNQHYDNVVLTAGIAPPPAVLASADFDAGRVTDQGDSWPGCCWEATSGTGGTGAVAGSGSTGWWAVGPNQTVRLTIDARTSGGSGTKYVVLQVGMPGDAMCAAPYNTGNCASSTVGSSMATHVVTITTSDTAQYVRYVSVNSQKNDNVTIELITE